MTTTTKEEVARTVSGLVEQVGLTLAEFIDAGNRGELEDGALRDLWLMYGDLLGSGGDASARG